MHISNWLGLVLFLSSVGFAGEREYLGGLLWSPETPIRNRIIESEKWISENEVQLIHVTSDAMKGALDIRAVVNSQAELLGLLYTTEKGDVLKFDLNQLSQGAELLKEGERTVVKIQGAQLNSSTGGNLELIYLQDGLTESYSKFNMMINNSQNNWEMKTLPNTGARRFTKMFLRGNWFFGKVIGISEVTVN